MDPASALLAGLAALGVNLAALVGGYVRIAERLTRLETQVALLMNRFDAAIPSANATHNDPQR